MNTNAAALAPLRFEIRFDSLVQQGRGLVFPCDPEGTVDVDALSERARSNYFFAWDTLAYRREPAEALARDPGETRPLRLRGLVNLLFLAGIMGGAWLYGRLAGRIKKRRHELRRSTFEFHAEACAGGVCRQIE